MYKIIFLSFLSTALSGCITDLIPSGPPKKELTPEEIALKKKQLDDAVDYFSKPMKVRDLFVFRDVEKLVLYKKDGYIKLDLHKYNKDKPIIPVKAYLDCSGKTVRGGFHNTHIYCSFERAKKGSRRRTIVGGFSVSVSNNDHEVTVKEKKWHRPEEVLQVKKGDMLARYWANGRRHIFIVDFDDSPLNTNK